jgi:hypothetical protein
MWRVAQFDTLRLRLLKLAARVVEMKTMIRFICRHHVQLRTFCVSRSRASRASSPEKRAGAPPNVEPLPSTRKPSPPSGSPPETVQRVAKKEKIRRSRRPTPRNRQSAA